MGFDHPVRIRVRARNSREMRNTCNRLRIAINPYGVYGIRMKSFIILIAAIIFGAVQMACACDIVMSKDNFTANQPHTDNVHNTHQHHESDSPCEGCEHCDDNSVFTKVKTETIALKVNQQVKLSGILSNSEHFLQGPPSTGPPDNSVQRRSLPVLTPVNLKVRLLN